MKVSILRSKKHPRPTHTVCFFVIIFKFNYEHSDQNINKLFVVAQELLEHYNVILIFER